MARGHYNVAPRYTGGSPAMVDEQTALQVAEQERGAFQSALEGFHGAGLKAQAERLGLDGIVEYREEGRRCWLVHDILVDQHFKRPFHDTLLRAGWQVQNEYGSLNGTVHENGRYDVYVQWENGRFERVPVTKLRCRELK